MKAKSVRLTETQIAFLITLLEGIRWQKGAEAHSIIAQLRKAETR